MLLLSQNISSGFLSLSEKAKVIAIDSKSCIVFVPIWLQFSPSPLLHQLTGPHAVSQICQTPFYLRALCAVSVWSIQMSTQHLSISHLYANVTCSMRPPFLHSLIKNCNLVPRHSIYFPALFLPIAPIAISYTVVITYFVYCYILPL